MLPIFAVLAAAQGPSEPQAGVLGRDGAAGSFELRAISRVGRGYSAAGT
jgi:hypothetical protein